MRRHQFSYKRLKITAGNTFLELVGREMRGTFVLTGLKEEIAGPALDHSSWCLLLSVTDLTLSPTHRHGEIRVFQKDKWKV